MEQEKTKKNSKKASTASKPKGQTKRTPAVDGSTAVKNSQSKDTKPKDKDKSQQDPRFRPVAQKPAPFVPAKRKIASDTAPPSLVLTGLGNGRKESVREHEGPAAVAPAANVSPSKRSRQEGGRAEISDGANVTRGRSMLTDIEPPAFGAHQREPTPGQSHAHPEGDNLYDAEIEARLEEYQELNMDYRGLCRKLKEENEALKNGNMMVAVEKLFEEQNAKMEEHAKKASQLAQYWREEAARLSEQVEKLGGGDSIKEEVRKLRNQLHEATQALLDHERAAAEKEKVIHSLRIDNEHLKKYARIPGVHYNIEHKCIQTDGIGRFEAGVQTGNAIRLTQAKALAPEGAENVSWYTNSQPAPGNTLGGDESYTLENQRTAYRSLTRTAEGGNAPGPSGSDMRIETNESVQGQGPGRGVPRARERQTSAVNNRDYHYDSVGSGLEHVRRQSTARRTSLNPKEFSFYSDSLREKGQVKSSQPFGGAYALHAVAEEHEGIPEQEVATTVDGRNEEGLASRHRTENVTPVSGNTSTSHISAAAGLLKVVGFREKPLPDGALQFRHPATGFVFTISPEASDDQSASGAPEAEWTYKMESWGNAEAAFEAKGAEFHDIFGGECIVPEVQLLKMCEHIRDTLSRVV